MSEISRSRLFAKLNPTAYKALESATVFCKLRGNPFVELVHWLFQLLQDEGTDLSTIVRASKLDHASLHGDFSRTLESLPRGASSISDLSQHIDEVVERAWTLASVMLDATAVRSGHVLIALLKVPSLRSSVIGISREFEKLKADDVAERFGELTHGSREAAERSSGGDSSPGEASGALRANDASKSALERFTQDLTARAAAGELDPVLGRDAEIRQVIDILMRRRQNNPILTGEPGVGKTSVAEGFAQRVVKGDVPPALKDVSVLSLDLGMLQAGASMKGEFEKRLRDVIDEVQGSTKPIIVFIDEAHTLIGAGGAAGTGDAANLLKPALARGKLRTIAATTWAEYKKYFEKDPALTRRFQVVQVGEPSEATTTQILRGLVPILQRHHGVVILDSALEAASRLSHRYIPERQLPDKAVSLLDTACARVGVSQHATPAVLEDQSRELDQVLVEIDILEREQIAGEDHEKRLLSLRSHRDSLQESLEQARGLWARQSELVKRELALRTELTQAERTPEERQRLQAELRALRQDLQAASKDQALVLPTVDDVAIGGVVQDWTGIPLGKMVGDEVQRVLSLGDLLGTRVIGQQHGLNMIAKRIQTSRAALDNPSKPIGVFMLCGPSGVGKTETALALADTLYGGEQNVITINMSEYQEAHTVSSLKGAPPGYVGYGEGGVLTEAVRRRPYSVVLLDEVEKAHPDVHEIFFQVFDKGWMEDGEGRYIDFKNTLILLTSNVGTDLIMKLCADPEFMPDPDTLAKALREPQLKVFPPALLGRIVTIPYYPLSDEMMGAIIRLQLDKIVRRMKVNHQAELTYGEDVVKLIASRCTEIESGGRMIDAILTNSILPKLSELVLSGVLERKQIKAVAIQAVDSEFSYQPEYHEAQVPA